MSESQLETFIGDADVRKSHEIVIKAPANIVFDVAEHFDLESIPVVHFLFKLRALLLRVRSKPRANYPALVSETTSLGWIKLACQPGRELIMGAVAQPWVGNVEFKAMTPDEFAGFSTPGFVKIVWTLETDPLDPWTTLFRTQTRVAATSAKARRRFRLYWIFAGKLVSLIRILGLRAVRREAQRRLL